MQRHAAERNYVLPFRDKNLACGYIKATSERDSVITRSLQCVWTQ